LDFANQPEKQDSRSYVQAFLNAWNHKYAQVPNQQPALEKEKQTSAAQKSIDDQNELTLPQVADEKLVLPPQAEIQLEKTETIQQTGVDQPAEISSENSILKPEQPAIAPESVESKNDSAISTETHSMTTEDPINEETVIEAITGPGLPTNSIETSPVQPVLIPPSLMVFDSQKDLGKNTRVIEPVTAKKEEPVKATSAVRIRPLDPNSKKTPYTKQSQTRRIVTVDIIEVIPVADTKKDQ
jgi:hypothetical protein